MAFEQQINNFVNYGAFNYQFDEAGNLILNMSSSVFQQNFLSMNLVNFDYDQTKILNFYDPTFQEFIKPQQTSSVVVPFELQEYIDNISKENEELRQHLDEVITNATNVARDQSNQDEIKDIILSLRSALKQGNSSEDFYTTFPYLPLTAGDKSSGETTVEEMLPGAPQLLQPAPGIVFAEPTGSSSGTTVSTAFVPKEVIMVTKVKPLLTNVWSQGLKLYTVTDPRTRKKVSVVSDLASGLFVDRKTNTYYSLPAQFQ